VTVVTRAIPGLFGGVSQQIPAMRHPTQCSEQDNAISTLVHGLYKRPGSTHVASLKLDGAFGASVKGSNGRAYGHVVDRGDLKRYQLVLASGSMMLYDMETGAVQTVSLPHGTGYLDSADPANDFRCVTVSDCTFIVNRRKVPAMLPYTAPANQQNVGYIQIRSAVVKTDYTVLINGTSCTHTTGETATTTGIARALASAINTTMGGAGVSATVLAGCNVIKVWKTDSSAFTCSVTDGWGEQATRALHNGVEQYSDLPSNFEQGYTIKVGSGASGSQNVYYVAFVDGRWTETVKPGVRTKFDPATLPHQLVPMGDGTWTFKQITWEDRKTGDDDTNPLPSFIGTPINSVFFFRNRLGFLASDTMCLSRSGQYFNFTGSSAAQVLDTDPIDLAATSEQVVSLEWAVPYHQSLLVWATDRQQFVLTGGDILSPNNARLMPSTTFDADTTVRPVSIGNKVLFVSRRGSYSQVNLYQASDDMVSNTSEDLTQHCPEYVPAAPTVMVASTLLRMAALAPPQSKELYLFKWDVNEQEQLSQKAWCRFRFDRTYPASIIGMYWVSRRLYILWHVNSILDFAIKGRFVLEYIDFEKRASDTNVGYSLGLDSKVQATLVSSNGVTTTFDVPYLCDQSETILLKCDKGAEPVPLVVSGTATDASSINPKVRFTVMGSHINSPIFVGRKFNMRYTFTEVFARDQNNMPIMAASVKLAKMTVRYVDTGWFTAKVTPFLRDTYTYPLSGRTVGMPGQGPTQLALSTGDFSIPVQAKAANTTVTIESDSYLPVNIPYAEWVGDVTMKAAR